MNSFGTIFRVSVFGESHGTAVGAVIDGVPAGIAFAPEDMQEDLSRRKSGAKGTTPRMESDSPRILCGTFDGYTTGAPVTILFSNEDTRSGDYKNLAVHPRPGHADFVAQKKFHGFADYRGGGHFSGRITLGLVAAGVLAKKILDKYHIRIQARIIEIGGETDRSKFDEVIGSAIRQQDSVGGVLECAAQGIPAGWGAPFFDSVESLISHAVFSIPAVRGIAFGEGFEAARMKGSQHNDPIIDVSGKTATNYAGGVNGGITNGNELVFRAAIKPTASIGMPQKTVNMETGRIEELRIEGRHDACIALRVPVILEAVTAIVLADLSMR